MRSARPGRSLAARALVALAAAAVLLTAAWNFARPLLAAWVAGPEFARMMSGAVSHALKVDGRFGPMRLGDGFTVVTDGFTSTGWPGQAISGLDTGAAAGVFDPLGVLRGVWRVDTITVARADFRLRQPDDALKADDPPAGPRPWYSALMPREFSCGWIECPDMQVELPLGALAVRGGNLEVGAAMIGRNFKYYGRNGTVRAGGYPPMAADAFEVYVTRDMIEVGYLYLRDPASSRSNIELRGRLGQHADRSIRAQAVLTDLDVRPFLPGDVARILTGRLSGRLDYETDTDGANARGSGALMLPGARLEGWDFLERLARRAGDPALTRLEIDGASLDYTLADGRVDVTRLDVRGAGRIDVRGRGTWDIRAGAGTASVSLGRLPLGAWLPASLSGGLRGELSAEADWAWRGADLAGGRGGGRLMLSGGELRGFQFQEFLAKFLRDDGYLALGLAKAVCRWRQEADGLRIEEIDILSPGKAGLRGSLRLAPDGTLEGTVTAGLPESSLAWLPDATTTVFAGRGDGLHWCTIQLSGTEQKPENDFAAQVLRQLEKHPAALAELALRGLGWWLGDVFGGRRER